MMLKLELRQEQDPDDTNSRLLRISLFQEGRGRSQIWKISVPDCIYMLSGPFRTALFSLQASFPGYRYTYLHNKISKWQNQQGATYCLGKYVISLSINGIYSDVLACVS